MRSLNRFRYFLFLSSLSLFHSPIAAALEDLSFHEKERLTTELEEVHDSLSTVTHSLKSDRLQLNSSEKNLQGIQKDIKQHTKQITTISNEIGTLKKEVVQLQEQQKNLQKTVNKHQKLLSKNLASIYMPRSNAELKLLLNQKSSAELRRSLGLYTYLQNAQRDAILESINALQTASQLEQETLGKQHTLEQKQLELSTLSVQLIAEKEKKEGLIETLKTTISEKSLSRKALHDRQKDLQKVLVEVGETLIQAQEKALPQGNILAMQGQLAWPIETPALSANSISLTKNRGLLIKISPNTPVKAIYPGKVVFADWLKGYGLLIIIDHGDKFMSLYAYNDQLLKHPGEQVLQGDIIAMVGDADQNPEDMNLYFELRHQGEPVNPTQWLSERG